MSSHSYFKFYQLHKLVMSSIWLLAVHSPSAAAVAFFLALVLWLLYLTWYYKSAQDVPTAGKNLQVAGAEKCVKQSLLLWHLTCCLNGKYVRSILIVSKSFEFGGFWSFFVICLFGVFLLLFAIRCAWYEVHDIFLRKNLINVISAAW